jgi:hypothetical protein
MTTSYKQDTVAWAREQAALLREGRFSELDLANIAEEIEDVGKSEQREIESRLSVLLAHLLKWKYQPLRRGNSWLNTMRTQRGRIERRLTQYPSLRPLLTDEEFMDEVWEDAVDLASRETEIQPDIFPTECPWQIDDVKREGWLPPEN